MTNARLTSATPARLWSTARTSIGAVRQTNEDRFLDRPDLGIWAVADGMGGHERGDLAAARAVEALDALTRAGSAYEQLLSVRTALGGVNDALIAEAARLDRDAVIGATIAVLLVFDGHYACVWAGDSRVYRIRQGALEPLTQDHSVAQELAASLALTESEASKWPGAHMITRALGAHSALELDVAYGAVESGDGFLLCSDGLYRALPAGALAALVRNQPLGALADVAIAEALARGASDNVTLVLVQA
jgi:protein phosphatase/serine/threonine-protein phosphatase Stp1